MSLFSRLVDVAAVLTTPVDIDYNVVIVTRSSDPFQVRPGMTALDSALAANHLDEDQVEFATFTIIHPDKTKEEVDEDYICQGGQKLEVTVDRDGKGLR
jgi:hypothetical protein